MENFMMLENNAIQVNSGVFAGIEAHLCYPSGELEGIRLSEKNMLVTYIGELVPAYTETTRRKNKYSVQFHKNGMVKAVSLDEQQEIETPIGEFPAELVTFYNTGELYRFFPLDGKISGFWSEEEEKALCIPFSFDLGFAQFVALLSGVVFYKSGAIKSIALFPAEVISVTTKSGVLYSRQGISLFESGELESLEPEEPTSIQTPIGKIIAYDTEAVGVNADKNSLMFDVAGRVKQIITAYSRIAVQTQDGSLKMFRPSKTVHPLDDDAVFVKGMKIGFDYESNTVTIVSDDSSGAFFIDKCGFHIEHIDSAQASCSPTDCAGCSLNCGTK
ncbi:hypothetical protein LQZ18_18160 [Lachnospiraceae bacterium ZAX-1]